MSKILLISWSPKKWDTDRVLSRIFENLEWDKEMILLREKDISRCLWCRACQKTAHCVVQDDMQYIMKKLLRADVIVLWSPNHFANVSGDTKDFIDRTIPFYHKKNLKWKKIILLMPGLSVDSTNKKYIIQSTHGLVKYHGMKLLWAYGWITEDAKIAEKKADNIAKQIIKKLAE